MSVTSALTAPLRQHRPLALARARADVPAYALDAAPALLALMLWGISLGSIDLARVGDYGLLPALPWTYYAALAVLLGGFGLALRRLPLHEPVLGLHLATLILILHGTPAIAYGTLRYAWAWKHVGIVDYIQRHGSVDPEIQFLTAYHNWPGFFAVSALYTELAGFASALDFASWAPVFFNVLFSAAIVVLFGALTADRRRVWLGVWIFESTSWVGQDYFSPQAFAYFLFLVTLGIALWWFRSTELPSAKAVQRFVRSPRAAERFVEIVGRADAGSRRHAQTGRGERAAMLALLVLLGSVIAASHQLTPMMLVLALAGLVLCQRISLRGLPALVAAITLGWVALFAIGFLRGNLYWIVDSVGTLTTNAGSTLINLGTASPAERNISQIDRALTLGMWVLAALGFVRLARRRQLALTTGVLAAAPFLMLGATSYGGEILFRVYFFSLPFTTLLVAGLFYPLSERSDPWRAAAARTALGAVLLAAMLVAYYGKERQNYFSHDEVAAAKYLYHEAPAGSLLVGGVNDYPWAFTHYEDFQYLSLADLPPAQRRRAIVDPGREIAKLADYLDVPCVYTILTASQEATVDMTGVLPAGSLKLIERRLISSTPFRLLLRNSSAVVVGAPVTASASACRLPR